MASVNDDWNFSLKSRNVVSKLKACFVKVLSKLALQMSPKYEINSIVIFQVLNLSRIQEQHDNLQKWN